jgi:hypothetical protein
MVGAEYDHFWPIDLLKNPRGYLGERDWWASR